MTKGTATDLFVRGNAALDAGAIQEAIPLLEAAYKARPTAITAQGATLAALAAHDWKAAKHYGRIACKLAPDWADNWHRLGAAHWGAGEWTGAEKAQMRCLRVGPHHLGALEQLVALYGMLGDDFGEHHYARRALSIEATTPINRFHQATLLLWQGRYLEGWAAYEHRHELPLVINGWRQPTGLDPAGRFQRPFSDAPTWEYPNRLLCYHEQGQGDAIQMARYHPLLAEQCGALTVLCRPSLVSLFQAQARGRWDVQPMRPETPAPAHDAYVGAMSLPYLFGTTVETVPPPADFPIAHIPSRHRIALCRKGSPTSSLDLDRSCHTNAFDLMTDGRIEDITDMEGDWADTAHTLATYDLVVTVDTAIAHLAGSMGIETWIVPPTHFEWRHMQGREDNPWYPSWRYYRRKDTNDWPNVVARIKADLDVRHG